MSEYPRDVLLKHTWSYHDLQELYMIIQDRGSPGDISCLDGESIERVGRSFIELKEGTMIPYHRILAIYKNEELLWKRKTVNLP